jgi:hypothetical protein
MSLKRHGYATPVDEDDKTEFEPATEGVQTETSPLK